MMTDFTQGDPLQRYANVNSLILDTYQQKCLDFTYDKMVADMRKTDWASGAAEGGTPALPFIIFESFFVCIKFLR